MIVKIAHRGFSAIAPENTMVAFQKALELNVDCVELDVHGTIDKKVVAIHDQTLNRTTNQTGFVNQQTLNRVRQADAGRWFDDKFTGEKIPTLTEALDLICPSAMAVVEVKDAAITDQVVKDIHRTNTSKRVVVIAFDPMVLKQVRQLDSTLSTGFLLGGDKGHVNDVELAAQLVQQVLVMGVPLLNLSEKLITSLLAHEIKKRGVTLWTWTIDDLERMKEVVDSGVQGITSNQPKRLSNLEV
ncbi:MAG: glycerophosphodiester phosphodiesterase family protein [Candidatus Poribacteria bacterium]|nr:glycerophosphodiester phosphodiesterase family protein [Candidatus Poribacteria bacterium]